MFIVKCDPDGIEKASKIIAKGGIAVFPTDTVYGIGCDPFNKKAVNAIYEIKKREKTKHFPVLGRSLSDLEKIVEFDKISLNIANHFWPGKLTLVLPVKEEKFRQTLGIEKKLAVRIPKNECVSALLKNCKFLVGTSANMSGEENLTNANDCVKRLSGFDVLIDGGEIKNSRESTIIEIDQKVRILREGFIPKEEILKIL